MQKITLPLVMIASLATLVSCGQKSVDTSVNLSPTATPVVTGVVVTPAAQTGTMGTSTTSTTSTSTTTVQPTTTNPPVTTSTVSVTPTATTPVTQTPRTPETFTRRETVSYSNPSGTDTVEFNVTVTDGIITSASATPKADNEISLKRQTAFAAEVSSKVVGKKASDLNIDAIGGSSLTTAAFEKFVHSF